MDPMPVVEVLYPLRPTGSYYVCLKTVKATRQTMIVEFNNIECQRTIRAITRHNSCIL